MDFPRTYYPDKIFTNKDLFEYAHQMELKELLPLKSQLKYDTSLTNRQRYELIEEIVLKNTEVSKLYNLLETRLGTFLIK
jgi:hypothetical protein